MNPYDNIDKAFEPFFYEKIKIVSKNGTEHEVSVSKFDESNIDPFSEENIDTDEKTYLFLLQKKPTFTIKRGDIVKYNNTNLKVYKVEDNYPTDYRVYAR